MTLTSRSFAGFVLAASAAVLGVVFLSQYWGGLGPCELCLLQRWPWAAAGAIAIIVVLAGDRGALPWVAALFAIVFAISAALAFYHVGVEGHWLPGPSACTAGSVHPKTVEEMRAALLNAAPVQCDQVAWSLFGVSLAGWNLVASLAMVACCLVAMRRAPGRARRGVRRGAA